MPQLFARAAVTRGQLQHAKVLLRLKQLERIRLELRRLPRRLLRLRRDELPRVGRMMSVVFMIPGPLQRFVRRYVPHACVSRPMVITALSQAGLEHYDTLNHRFVH